MREIKCPHCKMPFIIKSGMEGRKLVCSACLQEFMVPLPKDETGTEEETALSQEKAPPKRSLRSRLRHLGIKFRTQFSSSLQMWGTIILMLVILFFVGRMVVTYLRMPFAIESLPPQTEIVKERPLPPGERLSPGYPAGAPERATPVSPPVSRTESVVPTTHPHATHVPPTPSPTSTPREGRDMF